jgi:hypothetical protein
VLPVLSVSKNEASVLIFKLSSIGGDQRPFGLGGFFAFFLLDRERSTMVCKAHLTESVINLPPSPCLQALRSFQIAQQLHMIRAVELSLINGLSTMSIAHDLG